MVTRWRFELVWLVAALLIGQSGCASLRPSEEVRAQLGTVGVASDPSMPATDVVAPARGRVEGAGRGAAAAAVLDPALDGLKAGLQGAVRDRVLAEARRLTPHAFVPLPEDDFRAVKEPGIDTVLEINVLRFDLVAPGADRRAPINPKLAPFIVARARFLRVTDGEELHQQTFWVRGKKRQYVGWAEDGTRPLHEEVDRVVGELAGKIVEELFLR